MALTTRPLTTTYFGTRRLLVVRGFINSYRGAALTISHMGVYREEFPVGTRVRIKATAELEGFRRTWNLHHPLADEQMRYSGQIATVSSVGFYHGGDVLYGLAEVPGTWHEQLLEDTSEKSKC